ncbi:MAG TPA: hypothetical protein VFB99_17245 [Vicinamibacterales bacterium]|nr:hypothetical protein [Vicinamibacterales bacterium]
MDRDATRVLNGVNVWMYPTGCSELWEPCSDGTFRTKDDSSVQLAPRFDSFVVYKSITCSAIGMDNAALDDLARRAELVLAATLSAGVERALAEGVGGSSNPFFGDGNVQVLNSGTAVTPRIGISHLEQAIGLNCRRGMIHITPAVAAGVPAPLHEGITLATANGTPVVSGMGYQGIDTPFLATPGATQDWAFATTGVEVHLGPVTMTTAKQSLDRSDNVITFRAEQYVLAIWDGIDDEELAAAAVLVDWAT